VRGTGVRKFVGALAGVDRKRLVWVTIVQTLSTATQAFGIFLLIPMLTTVGVGGTKSTSSITRFWRDTFDAVGLSLTLRTILVVYVVMVAATAALNAYSTLLMTSFRFEFVDRLRTRLFGAIAGADWRHILDLRQSDLLSNLTFNVSYVAAGTLAFLSLLSSSLLVAAQLVLAFRIAPGLTLLTAATSAVLVALVWPVMARTRRIGAELVGHGQVIFASMTGFLDGLKLAKAHALEAPHLQSFDDVLRRSRRSELSAARLSALSNAVQLVGAAVVLAVLVVVAVERVHVDVAALLVLALVFGRLVPQITSAQRNVQLVAQSSAALDELSSVIAACEGRAESAIGTDAERLALEAGVSIEAVGFGYSSERPVLSNVSFEIPARQTIALVGPSGAGKTTLADIVVGLLQPGEGDVLVDGRSIRGEERRWRASVGLVPQEPFLFHDTVRANLLWAAPDADDDGLWTALDTAAAREFVAALPNGIDTVVGDRGVRLSGGERQRIALARALLRRPELLVLDEATSSLDSENELAIRNALTALHGQVTMLVIAHRLSTVRHADSIVVLDAGRVVETGRWEALADNRDGRLRALLEAGAIE
jgi:ATP-binding cassette subfamily C protein